jgi:hypothetical protein
MEQKKKFLKLLCSIAWSVVSSTAVAASISYETRINNPTCSANFLTISGEVVPGDALRLKKLLNEINTNYSDEDCKNGLLVISLSSNGGDVLESLKIGRVIRSFNLHTIVPNGSDCNSSCVFLLAGGVKRTPVGRVGIHRPYFLNLDNNLTASQIQTKRNELNKKIREYLDEVDVSHSLLEKMLSVPPESLKFLSIDELEEHRLAITDAAFDEKSIADQAAFYNLTSYEYRTRSRLVKSECSLLLFNEQIEGDSYIMCMYSQLLKISKAEVQRRYKKMQMQCSKIEPEKSKSCLRKTLVLGQ